MLIAQISDTHIKAAGKLAYVVDNKLVIRKIDGSATNEDKSLTPEDLDAFCKESPDIANFKRPRFYRFIEQIPRNATGKKLHVRIKEIAKDDLINGLLYRV